MSHLAASLFRQLRTVLAWETLPPAEPERTPRHERFGLARLLFSLEPLPLEPAAPARRRRSLLAMALAPEPLPKDPEPPRRRSRWLSWLFLPERVDRAPDRPDVD